ncbi:hypothetical protein Lalb_Chr21g0305001 [Lupinus albus]|uniref:Uncharacterized protein n=1 Tax=Lupinus albus TaxID=3870 RepID=A0A6A4NE73_LUPAL|nr:hypothetical protein Lalb_Chr21g0305001 [Lupinus albus]
MLVCSHFTHKEKKKTEKKTSFIAFVYAPLIQWRQVSFLHFGPGNITLFLLP